MKKSLIQGTISILLFFGTWFTLTQIDWVKIFKVEQATDKTEEKLGNVFWETLKKTENENKNLFITKSIDSIVTHICKTNQIEREYIKIHILDKDEVNAFAFPNGHLIIYSGLVLDSENQEELTGVICHEIAHIELNHVMKKLVKEIGLSVLISMTTSSGGTETIKQTAKILSSSAFDRQLEKEADIKAVDYMIKAKVNPEPLANFLYKLSKNEEEADKYLTWIGTHPELEERAKYIIEHGKNNSMKYKTILSNQTWDKLKEEFQKD